jgi:hypothetical protein
MPEWAHAISGWAIVHKDHITLLAASVSALMAVVVTRLTWTLATENRLLRKAGTEPEVVAYLLPNSRSINFLNLIVANVGRGPAFNVELEFVGDLNILQKKGIRFAAKSKFPILSVLPQDEKLVQFFGSYLDLCENGQPQPEFTIRAAFRTSDGVFKSTESRVSISDFEGLTRVGNSPEHDAAEALKTIAKSIESWAGLSRLKVETTTTAEVAREQQARYDEMMERRKKRDDPSPPDESSGPVK